jgi:hypothetical protein
MQKYSVSYTQLFWKLSSVIIEFEQEGVIHSNRENNAVSRLCRKYPQLVPLMTHSCINQGEGQVKEELCISNRDQSDYLADDAIDESMIRAVLEKIPRPYGVNDLEVVFDGVRFSPSIHTVCGMRNQKDEYGAPIGCYISYSRSSYGDEKHSYLELAVEYENEMILEAFRNFFFDFAKQVNGQYEGTQIIDCQE